ncbi:hypothetical protein [Hymenobacter lapidarius]|nr:hypothetical protein [Hymenobacter lapidarius]
MEEQSAYRSASASDGRTLYALIIGIIGLLIPAVLIGFLAHYNARNTGHPAVLWRASEITAVAGLFTSIVGTLVGAFLGVQVGAAGKDFVEKTASQAIQNAEELKREVQKLREELASNKPS